jgi:type I restriction enzyme S subunit
MINITEIPIGWTCKSLGDLVEFLDHRRIPVRAKERERRRGPYPYYGANGQIDSINGYLFDEPLVLLAEDGGFFGSKEHSIAYKIEGKSWVNNHAHVLRPAREIDIDYLRWVLSYYDVGPFLSGSTRFKLTKTDASRIPIPLPLSSINQRKIANILQRADNLKQRRRQANELTRRLLGAVFSKMFGNRLPCNRIGDVAEFVSSGATPLGGEKTYLSKGVVFIRSQNVHMNELELDDVAHISDAVHRRMNRTWVKNGDVLLNITGASLGRVAVYRGGDDQANVNQHVCIIRLDESKALPEYVSYYLSTNDPQNEIWTIQAGASRQALNFDQVRSLRIYVAPMPEQRTFASIVSKVDTLKKEQRRSTQSVDNLLASLMHKAFRGELNV